MNESEMYTCGNPHRLALIQNITDGSVNAIKYLEVLENANPTLPPDKLEVHFVHTINPAGDWSKQVLIEGGVRFAAPRVVSATAVGKVLSVTVEGNTDASTYTLRLVKSKLSEEPPDKIDSVLRSVDFSFRVLCPSDFDCKVDLTCEDDPAEPIYIDYLSKDYTSFRRLMLDRVTALVPGGIDNNPADPTVTLIEVLAYAADQLSYYQDAVSTEAYLGTSRLRTSLARHARLVDYQIDNGQNARTWIFIEASGPAILPKHTKFVSKHDAKLVMTDSELAQASLDGHTIFESMHDVSISDEMNEIDFHNWGDRDCCLEAGATSAVLVNRNGQLDTLAEGQLLLFEQSCDPASGQTADADPTLRHVVRILKPNSSVDKVVLDPMTGLPQKIVMISWRFEDALPFSLPLSASNGPAAKARGNLVLADHGMTIVEDAVTDRDTDGRLRLKHGPISRQARFRSRNGVVTRDSDGLPVRFDPKESATSAIPLVALDVWPDVSLEKDGSWVAQADLLKSDEEARNFVVETENNGTERLRFGDGVLGMEGPVSPKATYRVGNGVAGNVGRDAITHVVGALLPIRSIRNPIQAMGGRDPEPVDAIRKAAPESFKTQHRAVTLADYETVALGHPEVQRVKAQRVWTGSWYATRLLVDRKRGLAIDAAFQADLLEFLESYRLANVDLEIAAPVFVPLDIGMTICVEAGYYRHSVKKRLVDAFSDKKGGFFDPDIWSFGQSIALSAVVEHAMSVTGVHWVDLGPSSLPPNRFQRLWSPSNVGLTSGVIKTDSVEVIRLDNDPSFPENGRIEFLMEGGL